MNSLLKGLDTSGKLRVLMAAKGITQAGLALLLDVTRETINNRFEANRWHVDDLTKIATILDVKPQDLI